MNIKKILFLVLITTIAISCAAPSTSTKFEAYPDMYGDNPPLSIVVVPAINKTTSAEASEFFNATINTPLSDVGYYPFPVEIVRDIFLKEGVIDSAMIKGLPTRLFKNNFGADAVMFVTINQWDRNYIVIGGNVTVGMDYVLLSTETSEVLWSYSATQIINTGTDSGNFFIDLIATAIKTAVTDYVPIAQQANYQAFLALPHGKYSKLHKLDQEVQIFNALKDKALDN